MILQLPYPISANRYWRTFIQKGQRVIKVSDEATAYKWKTFAAAKQAGMKIIGCPVMVSVVLLPKMRKNGEASEVLLDLDNALKVTIDALKGVAYIDDKQVRKIEACYGEPVKGGGLTVQIVAL